MESCSPESNRSSLQSCWPLNGAKRSSKSCELTTLGFLAISPLHRIYPLRGQQYDVAPDGRFLINLNVDETAAAPITVITNWNPEAKK